MPRNSARVLVVEDERELADLYTAWFTDRYDTDVAYTGTEAKEHLQQGRYDVVLLDRRLPDVTGGEILDTIRERDLDCRVAMVTAVSPDFDIIEMGIDSYVVKPVTADGLYDTVDRLHNLATCEQPVQQLYGLVKKRAVLEAEKTDQALAANEQYQVLKEDIAALRAETLASFGDVGESDFRSQLQGVSATDEEEPAR